MLFCSGKAKNKRKSSNPSNVTQMAPRYFLRTKEELEEEQKAIVDGADALLALAGINNNNNNNNQAGDVKLSTSLGEGDAVLSSSS